MGLIQPVGISRNPGSGARNTIQPVNTITIPLTIVGAAGTIVPLLEVQESSGQTRFAVDGFTRRASVNTSALDGHLYILCSDPAARGVTVEGAAAQTASLLLLRNNTPADVFSVGSGGLTTISIRDAITTSASDVTNLRHDSTGTPGANFGLRERRQLKSSTTFPRDAAAVVTEWVVATDATRRARIRFSVFDTASREGFRIEASGTAPMIGFLGGGAVVQQAGASAAGIAAIVDANAMAAIQALQTALANYNLVTSPP